MTLVEVTYELQSPLSQEQLRRLGDVLALSTAIPYCDVVVTDRKAWDVTKNRAHLDEEFNTAIFCALDDLVDHLEL